ncbi:MAG: hypothetical protein AVDCRST_MAG19-3599, partial [uncultured Thermomicrobiales bacterium]
GIPPARRHRHDPVRGHGPPNPRGRPHVRPPPQRRRRSRPPRASLDHAPGHLPL